MCRYRCRDYAGFASGFRMYDHADVTEFDGFMCNSKGGASELEAMGVQRVETVYWGVDPDLFAPVEAEQDRDVFFLRAWRGVSGGMDSEHAR
jgi:hypothetical protein